MTTYTWTLPAGFAASATIAGDWSPSGGPQVPGDVGVLTNGGTMLLSDSTFQGNTAVLGNGTMVFSGDTTIGFANPTLDQTSSITTATGLAATASRVDAFGNFVNDGSILADGAAGSSLTIDIGTTTVGETTTAGYFYNPDLIEATAGNSLTINIGASSELFNSGQILANGGSILIAVDTSAIAGGYAPNLGFAEIEGGGTVETQVNYPASFANSTTASFGSDPFYAFGDTTAGNTLKIDDISGFGGRILNFQAGDTIDLGTSLAVTGLEYSVTSGILNLVGSGNQVVASLLFGDGDFQSTNGTVAALAGGAAAGFAIGTSAGGDTILTAAGTIPTASNTSGSWQEASSWIGGVVPGTADIPLIGLGPVSSFVLTTGSVPVTVTGFDVLDHHATLQITSDTTSTATVLDDLSGTIEVTTGNTLTAAGMRTFYQEASVAVANGATLDLFGHPAINIASGTGTLSAEPVSSFGAQFGAGSVTVDGALLAGPTVAAETTGGADLSIGYDGNGSASVTVNGIISGSTIGTGTVTDTHLTVGSDPTSSGTLTLNGTGASWTDVMVPGSIDAESDRGESVIGYNDLSSNTPSPLAPPPAQGAAVLTIENGATMTEQEAGFIGYSPDSTGSVTVTTGGVWDMADAPAAEVINNTVTTVGGSGFVEVGEAGTGFLSVLNGGTVEAGVHGSFFGNGASFGAGGVQIGQSIGAMGSVLVSGTASSLSSEDGMTVGNAGTAFLTVENAASVSITENGIAIGESPSAAGSIDVGGTGAAAFLTLGTATNGISVGEAGSGTLEVDSLGTVTLNGTSGIGVGGTSTGTGAIIVNGGLLSMAASTAGIGVGQTTGATASLLIENDGTVLLRGEGISAATTATGDSGTITVESGGLLETAGSVATVDVGKTGDGVLIVTNGGSVSDANDLRVGVSAGASGSVTVSDGTITAANIILDNAAGLDANGTVTLLTGGVLNATGTATVQQHGVMTMAGGTLNVSTAGSGPGLAIKSGGLLSGFGKVTLGSGAGFFNQGQVVASGGTLELPSGSGNVSIASGAELQLDQLPINGTFSFSAGLPETFFINAGVQLSNGFSIDTWQPFDTLSFDTSDILSSASLTNGNTLIVNWTSGAASGSDSFADVSLAAGAPTNFTVSTNAGVGSVTLACFAEGTRIRTAHGLVPVEALREGDHLALATSDSCAPIVWIGQTRVNCRAHPDPESVWPVRIAAGAFAPVRPIRDLYLSPDHAVFVNDVLVPVRHLINGSSIVQVKRDRVRYFHVELERHEIVLAEEVPVESYLDAGDRANFGDSGVVRLHPDFAARLGPGTASLWETRGAAQLIQAGPALAAARAAVAGRATSVGARRCPG